MFVGLGRALEAGYWQLTCVGLTTGLCLLVVSAQPLVLHYSVLQVSENKNKAIQKACHPNSQEWT